jgi:tetratricopeptide (TPR) repeat protein
LKKLIFISALLIAFFTNVIYAGLTDNQQAMKYYSTGVSYHKKKDFNNALMYYNAAIKKDRKFWQAWLGLGICYYSMAKYRNAKLIFSYVLTLKPGEPTAKKYYDIMSPKSKKTAAAQYSPRTKGEMMWRSAVLPGLGQFYNGEIAKGYIYSIAYIAGVSAIIKYTLDQRDAVAAYNNANSDFSSKYKAARDAQTKIIIPAAIAAGVWSISVLDAFLSGDDGKTPAGRKTVEIKYDGGITVAWNIARVEF